MDKQWVKILAESRLENGEWKQNNPATPREHGRNQILRTAGELFQDIKDALIIINEHSRKDKKMTAFPMYDKDQESVTGFILVLGRLQLQVMQHQAHISVSVARMHGYQQELETIHQFEAHCDPFGGISWIMDQKSIMTKDMMVKQLLHDMCHEAYLSEWS